MNENTESAELSPVKSGLATFDAHVIAPEEYEDLPEWTEEMFAEADLYRAGQLVRRGESKSGSKDDGR
jgi:hypothetical protein